MIFYNRPDLYRASIRAGFVDHHSVDAFLLAQGKRGEKCSTQMAVDYSDDILAFIEEAGIQGVATHEDSDCDAVCSSYLLKGMIEHGRLPAMAAPLAEVVNRVDYGKFNEADPDTYARSLPGTFGAIKAELNKRCQVELKAKVFTNLAMKTPEGRLNSQGIALLQEIKKQYQDLTNSSVFELLNAINGQFEQGNVMELDKNIDAVLTTLPENIREYIANGRQILIESQAKFQREFDEAEKTTVSIPDKKGNLVEVDLVIGQSQDPLAFTNQAYQRVRPETIVAVWAGKERSTGDYYDIGIMPEQGDALDLKPLCLAINRAEKAKRNVIEVKADTDRSSEERELMANLASQPDRRTFPGLEEIIKKDPTVLVAGGTLIAASRSALLSQAEFAAIIKQRHDK